jgi:hypothetical protein
MNERREVSTKFDIMVDFVFEIKKKNSYNLKKKQKKNYFVKIIMK